MLEDHRKLIATITLKWDDETAAPTHEASLHEGRQHSLAVPPPPVAPTASAVPSVAPESILSGIAECFSSASSDSEREANRLRAIRSRAPREDGKLRLTDVFVLRFLCEDARRNHGDVTRQLTSREVADECEIGRRTAQIALKRLAMQGLIECFTHESGSREGRCFRLTPAAFRQLALRSVA